LTAPTKTNRDAIAVRMMTQFRVVLRELKCVGSQRLLRRGVSMSNLHVLSMLERHGEMAMSKIADALDVSFSNATGLIDRMEERGLVERVRDEADRRIVHVRLSDAGLAALADIEVFQQEALARVIAELDDAQLASLAATLDDLGGAVRRVVEQDPDLFAHNHQFHDPHAAPAARPQE
jgi:MarR family transcriptional regulator, organic hydroperoxide resistance regulator